VHARENWWGESSSRLTTATGAFLSSRVTCLILF
jgi:hypothetical protein